MCKCRMFTRGWDSGGGGGGGGVGWEPVTVSEGLV